ncbi:MAG: DUF72 domain-containing protein [Deltaproteobacteria bacterium]|nr:DUF72 domain-containing protein [Deltaproteobacteria bacterium]
MPSFRIGTSGWNYPHWKGVFYPEGLPKSRWLEHYVLHFDTVELNATFYRLPKPATFQNWRDRTPEGFVWSLKASRYLTHVRRLGDFEEPLRRFQDSASLLGNKLGPILFQLPPSLQYEEGQVREFLLGLDPSLRCTIEVRHPSWIQDTFFRDLRGRNVAFCISDTAGRYVYHEALTADFVYVRLHGSRQLYKSAYSRQELETWAEKLVKWDRDAYVYFDNDFEGRAVSDAARLREMLPVPK